MCNVPHHLSTVHLSCQVSSHQPSVCLPSHTHKLHKLHSRSFHHCHSACGVRLTDRLCLLVQSPEDNTLLQLVCFIMNLMSQLDLILITTLSDHRRKHKQMLAYNNNKKNLLCQILSSRECERDSEDKIWMISEKAYEACWDTLGLRVSETLRAMMGRSNPNPLFWEKTKSCQTNKQQAVSVFSSLEKSLDHDGKCQINKDLPETWDQTSSQIQNSGPAPDSWKLYWRETIDKRRPEHSQT